MRATHDANNGVEFLGIIPQQEIAGVLAASSFMLYPAAFPETFGISALESLNYNTPLITCRFGALEETALEMACYKIDYAIEPNGLFPFINTDHQVEQFVNLTVWAHNNRYLLQQKQNYCSVVKDLVGWNMVALQWKQHLYRLSDRPLGVEEFASVSRNQITYADVFGRRTVNTETLQLYHKPEQDIVVISPFYNCRDYISRCIVSVATQNYHNYTHILIDDASTDDSLSIAEQTILSCPPHIRDKFVLLKNVSNQGAVFNHHQALTWCRDNGVGKDAIIMLLDGDDWLVNRNDVLSKFNLYFESHVQFSYGSCWSLADRIPLIAQEYPPHIKEQRAYRSHQFNWIVPYTHMRAFRFELFDSVDINLWKNKQGEWFRAGGDTAVFYSLLECADPNGVAVMQQVLVNYNDLNPINDYKIRNDQQLAAAHEVLAQTAVKTDIIQDSSLMVDQTIETPSVKVEQLQTLAEPLVVKPKRILIGIPTAKYIEVETFKSIYDLEPPANCELEFQYFWGYNVEQVRNIMVSWALRNNFDYLLSVDSDIIMERDTLQKLLHCQDQQKAISSGVYIQRKEGVRIPEIYVHNPQTGGQKNIDISEVQQDRLIEVEGVGFGCCLVRRDVFEKVGNPWFQYHSNIEFDKVLSEDVDFCIKARTQGYKIVVDTSIKLLHISKQYLEVKVSK
jgi:GT2 family glycosyltransferase